MTPEELAMRVFEALAVAPRVGDGYLTVWPGDGATVDVELTTPDTDGAGGLRFRITVEERQ